MGINTLAYLPSTADLGDITLAIQKLTDADKVTVKIAPTFKEDGVMAEAIRGDDATFDSIFDVEIYRAAGFGDRREGRPVTHHRASIHLSSYHPETGMVGTLLYCGTANAFWSALSDGLVDFFGGVVDYNDCDAEEANTVKRPTKNAKVTDGDEAWTRKQRNLRSIRVVTDRDSLAKYSLPGIYDRDGNYGASKVMA